MGAPVEIGIDACGAVANASLIEHGRSLQRRLHKVTPTIYCQMGSSLGNSTMILGDRGMIVVDTGDCLEQSRDQLADFRTISDRQVSALVYSHSHFASGARTYIEPGQESQIPIYAHRGMIEVMSRAMGDLAPLFGRRSAIQFGLHLPPNGPDSMPNHGLGATYLPLDRSKPTHGFVRPNRLVEDGQIESIDGVRVQFWHAPADTEDTLLIWLPNERVAINNIAWPTMFNIYPLRGDMFRHPMHLLPGLDRILDLEPDHLIGVHGSPISGRSEVACAVTQYRDCIQYTYDQTVRGINLGLSPDELVEFVQLPDSLANGRLTGQFYGELSFYVRQIYTGLVGWFEADAVDLHPLPSNESAKRWCALAGGNDAILKHARSALDGKEYQWAAELTSQVLRSGEGGIEIAVEARQIKASALRSMGQVAAATNTRAWYLTQALELEGKVDTRASPIASVTPATVRQLPPSTFVNILRFRLDPKLSSQGPQWVNLLIGDAAFSLLMRNGIVDISIGIREHAACSIALSVDHWIGYVCGTHDSRSELPESSLRIEGDVQLAHAVLNAWGPMECEPTK